MGFLDIFFLSLVQGLTEFLPVSSSGHLVLAPIFLGEKDQGLLMDVALHVGTLLAILVYYRRDVLKIVRAVLFWKKNEDPSALKLGLYIGLATAPALLFGLCIHALFPAGIRSVAVITATTFFFGLLMGYADKKGQQEKSIEDITLKQALVIGFAQALALIPGTSRSGVTMTAARFLGFNRVDAARFSFLLGIPAMAGAGSVSFIEIFQAQDPGLMQEALLAVMFSFLAGLSAIHFMIRFLPRFGLMPFVYYRMALTCVLLAYLL